MKITNDDQNVYLNSRYIGQVMRMPNGKWMAEPLDARRGGENTTKQAAIGHLIAVVRNDMADEVAAMNAVLKRLDKNRSKK